MAGNSTDSKLNTGFREVFKYLSSSRCCIADDAILHILADVLAKRLEDNDDAFILQSGITDFLDHICQVYESIDASIVVLALKICSLLSSTERLYEKWMIIINKCYGKIWETKKVAGASVLTAFYESIRTATQHSHGVQWILSEYKGCIDEGFKFIEAGTSVFLEKSVGAFLSDFLLTPVRCNASVSEELAGLHQEIVDSTFLSLNRHCFESEAEHEVQKNKSTLRNLLRLTETICQCDNTVTDKLLHRQDFIRDIHKVAYLSSGSEYEICVKIISALLQKGVCVDVLSLTESLWKQGEITKALKLVSKVYSSTSSKDILTTDTCHSILTSSLSFVLREEKSNVWIDILRTSHFSKTQITNILSTTLSCLSQCQMNEMDAVLKVLQATSGTTDSTSSHLASNKELQQCCLQYCLDIQEILEEGALEQLVECVMNILKELNMDTVMYSMCMKCLHSSLPWLTQSTSERSLSTELADLIQRHLCSLKWELRDTTVEFIGNVAKEYKEEASVTQWLKVHHLHQQVWQCVQDGESYVRASAFSTLGHLLSCQSVWQSLLQCLNITEENLLEQVIFVLESDTEAFARRSAAEFLVKFYKSSTESISILAPFINALADFDWEVKLCALCFVNSVVQDHLDTKSLGLHTTVPEYAVDILPSNKQDSDSFITISIRSVYSLFTMGCLTGIMKCLDDFDEKVCLMAVESIEQLKNKLKLIFADHLCKENVIEIICQKVLSLHENDLKNSKLEEKEPPTKRFKSGSVISNDSEDIGNKNEDEIKTVKDFIANVRCIVEFDSEPYRAKFESQTDYYLNPWSLIQDILSYCNKDKEENLVDCY